jgi:hypothetical protein
MECKSALIRKMAFFTKSCNFYPRFFVCMYRAYEKRRSGRKTEEGNDRKETEVKG